MENQKIIRAILKENASLRSHIEKLEQCVNHLFNISDKQSYKNEIFMEMIVAITKENRKLKKDLEKLERKETPEEKLIGNVLLVALERALKTAKEDQMTVSDTNLVTFHSSNTKRLLKEVQNHILKQKHVTGCKTKTIEKHNYDELETFLNSLKCNAYVKK